jgi:hypothetical protein
LRELKNRVLKTLGITVGRNKKLFGKSNYGLKTIIYRR